MATRMVRKHILLSEAEAQRLDALARAAGCSQAAIIRAALAAYSHPSADVPTEDADALLELVQSRLAEATAETRRMRERIERLSATLEGRAA